MNKRIPQSIEQSIAAKNAILADSDFLMRIEKAAEMIITSLRGGGKSASAATVAALPMPNIWLRNSADASTTTVPLSTQKLCTATPLTSRL